jgi:hypothetical protein
MPRTVSSTPLRAEDEEYDEIDDFQDIDDFYDEHGDLDGGDGLPTVHQVMQAVSYSRYQVLRILPIIHF